MASTLAPAPFCAVGIDVGGTKIAAGVVVFPEGTVGIRQQIPTAPMRGGCGVLNDVLQLAADLIAQARDAGLSVSGLGLGVCEIVDLAGNIASSNCVAWEKLSVRDSLSKLAPAVVEADVRAAAVAEAMFGAGKPYQQFLYVTVGTGISSCLVLDRKPFTGARGATGTMASSPVHMACEHCGEQNHRTLEEVASGPALVARYNLRRPVMASSGQDVLAAAGLGDTDAKDVVRSAGEALGSAVALLVNVLDPEAIVVGGGLGLSEGLYWDSFVGSTRRHIWAEIHRHLPIVRAGTGQDAGMLGAAATAWQRFLPR